VARPPRPKAASPAKGLLPSLPICNNDEEIHRSEMGGSAGIRQSLGMCLREIGVYDDTENISMLEHVRHLARHVREFPIASKNF